MSPTYTPLQEKLIAYLRYPGRYFWRWSSEGVAEWQNGTTIAYAQELMPFLAALAPEGLPPLGAVLLILAACTDGWADPSAELGLLHGAVQNLLPPSGRPTNDELAYRLRVAGSALEIIRALPAELRTGTAKLLLLRELLQAEGSVPPGPPAEESPDTKHGAGLMLDTEAFVAAMRELGEHPPTLELLTLPSSPATRPEVEAELLFFDLALSRFPTVHSLELRLRTGLTALPEPLALTLPTPPTDAEPEPTDLLAELAQNAPTAGLARLAQRLAALLHLPQHADGAGSLPLGGVADVTNRGSFDRLLLSELAQDDLSLTARLVHGEALYLRREEPPAPQPPPRVVLVDTTIQLWGEPRVFALAAALAVAHPARPGRQPRVAAFALGGTEAQPLDLFSKAGVTEALGHLDPALHCGAALVTLLHAPGPAPIHYLLITEAEAATHPDFSRYLAEAAPALRFLLTVARGGEVAFYEFRQGRRTLLSTLQVDLQELLFAKLPATRRHQKPVPAPGQLAPPAFLNVDPCPLALPTVDFQPIVRDNHYQGYIYDAKLGLVGLTTTRRLLHWPRRDQGARELMHVLEEGKTCLGFDGLGTIYLLFVGGSRHESVRLYTIPLSPVAAPILQDFSTELEQVPGIQNLKDTVVQDVFFGEKDSFYLRTPVGYLALLCQGASPRLVPLAFSPSSAARFTATPGQLKGFVNNGYNVLQRISRIGVALGELTVGNHALTKLLPNVLKLQANKQAAESSAHTAHFAEDIYALLPNQLVRFHYATWPDGSTAITDSRGLLHLRSANPALPEITLVLVLGKSAAAWASAGPDGAVCGSSYLVQGSLARIVSVPEFYQLYIQPFIDHIVAHP